MHACHLGVRGALGCLGSFSLVFSPLIGIFVLARTQSVKGRGRGGISLGFV